MNRIPFQTWPVEHKAVSSVLRYARPRFHRLFRPSPPNQHDDAFRSNPAGWLPMNTTTTLFLHYTSPGCMYARVGIRDPARMYVRGRIFFLAHWPLYVHVHATCAPLLRHVRASTSTSMYVHVRDQNDNAMYASTRWVPTVRHFLACEDVAGGSQQSGCEPFFARTHFLACEDVAGGSQQSGGNIFSVKYSGPSGGPQLLGGGIIIFHVIRRHFLVAAVDPAVSLSMYSPRLMEVVR